MSRSPSLTAPDPVALSESEAGRIRVQLEHLLASGQFRGSRRCQLLLQYVTEHAVARETSHFKERTLGVAVFGREANYDTNQDPIVRATAAEIRKKLAQYYQEPVHAQEVRFTLLPGSYVPAFHTPEAPPTPPASVPVVPALPPVARATGRRGLIGLLAAALIAALVFAYQSTRRSVLDIFWGRMLSSNTVLFCVGQPAVFNFRSDAKQRDIWEKILKSHDAWPPASSPDIRPSELVPMPDRYFAAGDTVSLVHMATYFESRKTPYSIRNSSLVSFDDLKEHPAILVGAFDNDWTLRFTSQLRFSFERQFNPNGGATERVHDRDHPNMQQWGLTDTWPDWNVSRDYAIITRLLEPSTDRMMVITAGLTQYGTVAAAEFLTNPEYFMQAERALPRDWSKKNIQIVLSAPVVHDASGRPDVLAIYSW